MAARDSPTRTVAADTDDGAPAGRPSPTLARRANPASEPATALALDTVARERYQFLGEVGRGGLGQVQRACDRRLGREVAVKELLEPTPLRKAHFVREALITARLQHPSIVALYDAGFWPNGDVFYVMKLIDGEPLSERLRACTGANERLSLLPAVIAVAEAIAYAHAQRIVHRDLKPSNIVLGAYGEVMVVDWGVALELDGEPADGSIVGTPAYMSPEQAAGAAVDERADVYALGAILYKLLTGRAPYSGGRGASATLEQIRRAAPTSVQLLAPQTPRDLLAIVTTAMAREPGDRYPSAASLADELRRFQAGQLIRAREYSRWERSKRFLSRHRRALALLAASTLLLASFATASVWRIAQERTRAVAAEAGARQRARELVLTNARTALQVDPTETLAWLRHLEGDAAAWRRARLLIGEALERGVSRDVVRAHQSSGWRLAIAPNAVASAGFDGAIAVWKLGEAILTRFTGFSEVTALEWMPGNTTLLAADQAGSVRLVDPAQNAATMIATQPAGYGWATASDDGEQVVATGSESTQLWDRGSSRLRTLPTHGGYTWHAQFIGRGVVTTGDDGIVRLVDEDGARVVGRHTGTATHLAVSPEGRWVASGAENGDVGLWSIEDTKGQILSGHTAAVESLVFAADGASLWTASRDHTVRRWELATGAATELEVHEDDVVAIARAAGDRYLSASYDGTIAVWQADGELAAHFHGHRGAVEAVAATDDGETMVSIGRDGSVRSWQLPAPAPAIPISGGALDPAIAISSKASVLAVAAYQRPEGAVWRFDQAEPPQTITELPWCRGVDVSADGRVVVFGGSNGLRVLIAGDERAIAIPDEHVQRVALAPDAVHLAAGTASGKVFLATTRGELAELGTHDGFVTQLRFSPDGQLLATVARDGTLKIWRVGDHRLLGTGTHDKPNLYSIAWSSPTELATGGQDAAIRRWRIIDNGVAAVDVLRGHRSSVTALTFLRDGRLVSAGKDRTVRLWSAAGMLQDTLISYGGALYSLDVAPDETRVVTAGQDGAVRLWDLLARESRVLGTHAEAAHDAKFTADGTTIFSIGARGDVGRWDDALPFAPAGLRAAIDRATTATIAPGEPLATPMQVHEVAVTDLPVR